MIDKEFWFDTVCAQFYVDFLQEAEQYEEALHNDILLSMAKEREEATGVPYFILGRFVQQVN